MYQIPALKNIPGIFHAFSTRRDRNMSFIWGEKKEVISNRKKFIKKVGLDANDIVVMQVEHKDKLTEVGKDTAGKGVSEPEDSILTEGLITKEKGLYLFLLIADCLPVIFYDKEKRVLALVHAGWKSVEKEVLKKTIRELVKKHNSNPADIIVGIGPSIKEASYRFDPVAAIENSNEKLWDMDKWQPYFKKWDDGNVSIDIIGYGEQQLLDQGVRSKNIFISDVDTVTDLNFYSHYRDVSQGKEREGRFVCIAGMI